MEAVLCPLLLLDDELAISNLTFRKVARVVQVKVSVIVARPAARDHRAHFHLANAEIIADIRKKYAHAPRGIFILA